MNKEEKGGSTRATTYSSYGSKKPAPVVDVEEGELSDGDGAT